MANSDMALLTEKRLKEMEAEMNRYEIIFGKNYAVLVMLHTNLSS